MSLPDNNIRRLSTAYARGMIDSDTYRRLRTMQLGALEFEKEAPALPEDISGITVPHKTVDQPHVLELAESSNKSSVLWAIFGIAAFVAGAAIYFTYFN